MDSDDKTLKAGASRRGRAGAAVVLLVAALLAWSGCDPGPAHDDGDGIGTSPSGPGLQSDPQPRIAGDFDPTGCPAGLIVVMGSGDADVLQGSAASECFVGLAGDDLIVTGGGDDVVLAGEGEDRVLASPDATVLDAEDISVDAR